MSDPCKRCGDPDGQHEGSEEGTAGERNCALYRIGTELENLNRSLDLLREILIQLFGRS